MTSSPRRRRATSSSRSAPKRWTPTITAALNTLAIEVPGLPPSMAAIVWVETPVRAARLAMVQPLRKRPWRIC